MIIFYIGRDNSAYLRLYANDTPVDLDTITKLEIRIGVASFNTIDDASVITRDGDKYVLMLGAAGVAAGSYGAQLVAYSTDKPQGLVWGSPISVQVV